MRTVCAFSGSSLGRDRRFADAAAALGAALARRGLGLVYGGASVGLMGVLADAVLDAGGTVTGVIPRALEEREIAHRRLTELHVVASMHERKATMADLADGFVLLPGGFGSLDEFAEILTWNQLGLVRAPCGILDVAAFHEPLLTYWDRAVDAGLLRPEHRAMVIVGDDPDDLLDAMERWQPAAVPKWSDPPPT